MVIVVELETVAVSTGRLDAVATIEAVWETVADSDCCGEGDTDRLAEELDEFEGAMDAVNSIVQTVCLRRDGSADGIFRWATALSLQSFCAVRKLK